TNEAAPVAAFDQVFTHPITAADEWRRVRVTGTFDGAHQYVIRYRSNAGNDGYEIIAPLHTDSGKTVLVDRGFITLQGGTQIPNTAPPAPSGPVTIIGRVRQNEPGRDSAIVPVDHHARLIDSTRIGADLRTPVVNGYIDVISMTPRDPGHFQTIALPELNDGPHFWYAVQWFMFTGIGVLGVIVFIRGDLRDRRERLQQEQQEQQQQRQEWQDQPHESAAG
ncbi:MAG: SURF1 family protein, partial [Microlunatus sp.]|nr:SURF1 family protein [Microlunatus sp.]